MSGEFWSNVHQVYECLADEPRTNAFVHAIENLVKSGDVVIDVGSGTGVFALAAARAGAECVYAVEPDPNLWNVLEKTVRLNGFENVIRVVRSDIERADISDSIDVVVCELVDTGLIDEYQLGAMNFVHNRWRPEIVIPLSFECAVDLVLHPDMHNGFSFATPRYEFVESAQCLTDTQVYHLFDFGRVNEKNVRARVSCTAQVDGVVNGVRLSNHTQLYEGSWFSHSAKYCVPLILPIDELSVVAGQIFDIEIGYVCGGGARSVEYKVSSIT